VKIARSKIAALLAPTLGQEKSNELVLVEARRLRLETDELTPEGATHILEALCSQDGLVGVVARFALARQETLTLLRRASAGESAVAREVQSAPSGSVSIAASELLAYLAPSLGEEKAIEVLVATSAKLGLSRGPYSRPDALRILEAMAKAEGVIGVVARFATARFVLKYPA
jgi:hypothetical protein